MGKDLYICRVCLATNVSLYTISKIDLRFDFEQLTGISLDLPDDIPPFICNICIHLMQKYKIFRYKCQEAFEVLTKICNNKVSMKSIKVNKINMLNLNLTNTQLICYIADEPQLKCNQGTHLDMSEEVENENVILNEDSIKSDHDFTERPISNNTTTLVHDDILSENGNVSDDQDFIPEMKSVEIENNTNKIDEGELFFSDEVSLKNTTKKKSLNVLILPNNAKKKLPKGNKIGKQVQEKKKNEKGNNLLSVEFSDLQDIQNYQNAVLFYNNHPDYKLSKKEIKERLDLIDNFSKNYNVEVKFLTKEEQKVEIEKRKVYSEIMPYICKFCFRGFNIEEDYNTHMKIHDPATGDFECEICGIRCKSRKDRGMHINVTHLKRFTCKLCGKVTKSQSQAKAHFAQHGGATNSCIADKTQLKHNQVTHLDMSEEVEHEKAMLNEDSIKSDHDFTEYPSLNNTTTLVHDDISSENGNSSDDLDFTPEMKSVEIENNTNKIDEGELFFNNEVSSQKTTKKKSLNVVKLSNSKNKKLLKGNKIGKPVKDKTKSKEKGNNLLSDEFSDLQDRQNYRNAVLFYNRHPDHKLTKQEIKERLDLVDKFSKNYNVEVKFLTKEEQKVENEKRKLYYKKMPYICKFCFRGFSVEEVYNIHLKIHDPANGDFKCEICSIRCKSQKERGKHINLTHLKRFTCKLCGKVTKSQSQAKAHFTQHSGAGGATSSCNECEKKINHQSNYLNHLQCEHQTKAMQCPICAETFIGHGLKVHIGIVHKQLVQCTNCKHQFENKSALNRHLELAQHTDEVCLPGASPCPVCGLNFSTENLMRAHYDENHKSNFNCDQCDKSFKSKIKYLAHKQVHKKTENMLLTKIGGLMCEECGKGNFKNENELRSHQRLHTGERPYKCSLCPKTFRLSSLVRHHMKVHTDERRYKCPMCPKAFRQSAHRTAHLVTHTKERPHACSLCPKRYRSAAAAKVHFDTVHKGLPARRRNKQ